MEKVPRVKCFSGFSQLKVLLPQRVSVLLTVEMIVAVFVSHINLGYEIQTRKESLLM